jgi:hypothetical protein
MKLLLHPSGGKYEMATLELREDTPTLGDPTIAA